MTNAIDLAIAELGTVEWAQGSNPKVVAYFKDAGHPEVVDDGIAWCAAFCGAMLKRAGVKPSGSLAARSYLKWGNPVPLDKIQRGDIGVIPRGNSTWQGHVFFIERVNGKMVVAVGGNQRDSVNRAEYPISALLGVRRAVAAKPEKLKEDSNITSKQPVTPPLRDNPATQEDKNPSFLARLIAWLTKGA